MPAWKPATWCITGADGFIGSHLVERLLRSGESVRALVWYNAFGHVGWLQQLDSSLHDRLTIVAGDVRDPRLMGMLVANCERVVHLAALIGIPYSYLAPHSYQQTNVEGTVNLLQASLAAGCRSVVVVSTSEVYGSAASLPIKETHPMAAQSPYAASKIAAEAFARSFHDAFDLPVVVVRPFNTYGPRQSARAVIPTIIRQLAGGSGAIKLGATGTRRDLLYVADTVAGLIAAATADRSLHGQPIQLGTGVSYSIGDVAAQIAALMNRPLTIDTDPERLRPAESEVDHLLADPSRARELLGWQPVVNLTEGLTRTIEWFRIAQPPRMMPFADYHI